MTRTELSQTALLVRDRLGFIADELDTDLWTLMRHTTPRRATQAIAAVADDVTCHNGTDRYNRLLQLLRPKVGMPRR
jgi:hypothetical protein